MHISDSDILLKVENLSTGYGKRQVLFNVSLEVRRGEIVLLTGGNGSGKSTVLKAIYGLLNDFEKRKGIITFGGKEITNIKPYKMIENGLLYVPQKNNTFDYLTVKENLEVAANHLKSKVEVYERIEIVFEKIPELASLKNRTPFNLSGGEKQKLALAMALMNNPIMIILDEPGAGLAPYAFEKNLKVIEKLNDEGFTFLIVEHKVTENIIKVNKILKMKLGQIYQ